MSMFEDRERAAERQFVLKQELTFKITARRSKLLGLWAAGELGLVGDEATRYATKVVDAEIAHHDDGIIIQKVVGDLQSHGCKTTQADIVDRLNRLTAQARQELARDAGE